MSVKNLNLRRPAKKCNFEKGNFTYILLNEVTAMISEIERQAKLK